MMAFNRCMAILRFVVFSEVQTVVGVRCGMSEWRLQMEYAAANPVDRPGDQRRQAKTEDGKRYENQSAEKQLWHSHGLLLFWFMFALHLSHLSTVPLPVEYGIAPIPRRNFGMGFKPSCGEKTPSLKSMEQVALRRHQGGVIEAGGCCTPAGMYQRLAGR
jgi:hypothetical protein